MVARYGRYVSFNRMLAISQSLMLYSENTFSPQISRRVTLASYFATTLNSPTWI